MKAITAPQRLVGKALTSLGVLPKAPKLPAQQPMQSTDDARNIVINQDALRRRRGGAADLLLGAGGAEAGAGVGGKDTLGS